MQSGGVIPKSRSPTPKPVIKTEPPASPASQPPISNSSTTNSPHGGASAVKKEMNVKDEPSPAASKTSPDQKYPFKKGIYDIILSIFT